MTHSYYSVYFCELSLCGFCGSVSLPSHSLLSFRERLTFGADNTGLRRLKRCAAIASHNSFISSRMCLNISHTGSHTNVQVERRQMSGHTHFLPGEHTCEHLRPLFAGKAVITAVECRSDRKDKLQAKVCVVSLCCQMCVLFNMSLYVTFPIGSVSASKCTTLFPLPLFFSDNGFIPESLLEDVMKALDLVSEPEQ